MTNPLPDQLHDAAPCQWSLETSTTGQQLGDAKHARWSYDPRPQVTVEVTRVDGHSNPVYTTTKSTPLLDREFDARADGFGPQVAVAEQLMHGMDGISGHDINHRLGQKGVGHALAPRVDTWSRLCSLYEESDGDLTYIDGFGQTANDALSVAVEQGVLKQQSVDAVRSTGEARDNDAVYVIMPTVAGDERGWRVRKEWRKRGSEKLQSLVFLPVEDPMGATFETVDAAVAAAQDAARERTEDQDALTYFDVDGDVTEPPEASGDDDQLTITELGD